MWAFRRASIHLRNRGLSSGTAPICCGHSEIGILYLENSSAGFVEIQEKISYRLLSSTSFCRTFCNSLKLQSEVRTFSSQAGARSSDEEDDDLEDAFSELGTSHDVAISADENDNDLTFESELSREQDDADDTHKELEPSTETDVRKSKSTKFRSFSKMYQAITLNPALPVRKVLDKWVEAGNEVTQAEVSLTMLYLRKRKFHLKALQLSEWLESSEHIEFHESNYASHVDLVFKVKGPLMAEEYLKKIPESFSGQMVYGCLLANFVAASDIKKSEEVFKRMQKSGLPVTTFSCNQLLLLYSRIDKKKIADVLILMENENLKPSFLTYQILIDVKGRFNDITGMEKIVETMKEEKVEPNTRIKIALARHYANAGVKDKAEALLKEIEGDDLEKHRWACQHLLPMYASLGREDEVERIWKVCEPKASLMGYLAGIVAWGRLKRIEKAEEVFDKMRKFVKIPTCVQFTALLDVYADNKLFEKGTDLIKQMGENGCRHGPTTFKALVKFYLATGEVGKAETVLKRSRREDKGLFSSYLSILNYYASKGDVHNAEKMFSRMRQVGYAPQLLQYQVLLEAYLNAKIPTYGFRERMRGDNVVPSTFMAKKLARADGFGKSAISDLLQ